MIARDAEPIGNRLVYKPIDVSGRRPRRQVEEPKPEPEPTPAVHDWDFSDMYC